MVLGLGLDRSRGIGVGGVGGLGHRGCSHLHRPGGCLQQRGAHAYRVDRGPHTCVGQCASEMHRIERVEDLVADPVGVQNVGLASGGPDRSCFYAVAHGWELYQAEMH